MISNTSFTSESKIDMTHFDDLEVGSWVTVTRHRPLPIEIEVKPVDDNGDTIQTGPIRVPLQQQSEHWAYDINGLPYQIQRIQLPFVVLYSPTMRTMFALDKRQVEFMLMTSDYVETFKSANVTQNTIVPKSLHRIGTLMLERRVCGSTGLNGSR